MECEVSMTQTKAQESKILTVGDEHTFFSLIEERLEQQGFELLDTFNSPVQRTASAELT
jgi:hypothetical protein